jgi:hypothetical protein
MLLAGCSGIAAKSLDIVIRGPPVHLFVDMKRGNLFCEVI